MKISSLWKTFEDLPGNKNKVAVCKICLARLSYRTSTSNLKRHMQRKHPAVPFTPMKAAPPISNKSKSLTSFNEQEQLNELLVDPDTEENHEPDPLLAPIEIVQEQEPKRFKSNLKAKISPNKHIDDVLMGLFIYDFQPFSIVQDKGFRAFVQMLNPLYKLPDRRQLSNNYLQTLYRTCRTKKKGDVSKAKSVCLTTEFWTSCVNELYMAVTAQYIDDTFHTQTVLLECCQISGGHTSANIAKSLLRILNEWDLHDKVHVIYTENSSNMETAVEKLECECFGYYGKTINLIVEELTTGNEAHPMLKYVINKIREIVSHFKETVKTTETLISFQKEHRPNETPKKLFQDDPKNWHSTFKMLERVIQLEEAIEASLASFDEEWLTLSPEEWTICKQLCIVLDPFHQINSEICGKKYVSGSKAIILTRGLLSVLKKMLQDPAMEDELFSGNMQEVIIDLISKLVAETQGKFQNLGDSNTMAMAMMLDPRFKLRFVNNSSVATKIKDKVTDMVAVNIRKKPSIPLEHIVDLALEPEEKSTKLDIFEVYRDIKSTEQREETPLSKAVLEIQSYLDVPNIPITENPLDWWRTFQPTFPNIANIVKEHFSFIATSEYCDKLFSKAGIFINEKCTKAGLRKFQQLCFLNCNYEIK